MPETLIEVPKPRIRLPKPQIVIRPHEGGKPLFVSNPGKQTEVLHRMETEVLYGGKRGGGKTVAGIIWLLLGNWTLKPEDPYYSSYLGSKNYAALVLRRNATDLSEWVEEAKHYYTPLGAKVSGKPAIITWPSGARFYTNHLESDDAFEKYKGWNIWKILVEELTLIPKRNQYIKLLGSLRAFNAEGKVIPQLFATTNPDGAGSSWVCNRFVEVPQVGGAFVPWGTRMRDPNTNLTRVFISAGIDDNPYARSNPSYMGQLLEQDKATQDAWIHGLWHSQSGTFFTEWRNQLLVGPRDGEPAHANHVIRPVVLKPWWFRWGGGDWGYKHYAALYKFCKNQSDGRIHCYDELVMQGVGAFDLGTRIAKWWMPDLERLPDRNVTIHFSPETFDERDARNSIAQQVQAGIMAVLGPGSSFIVKKNQDEKSLEQKDMDLSDRVFAQRRRDETGPMCITLQRANHNRPAGASFIRDLLRWNSVEVKCEPDLDEAKRIFELQGLAAYEDYMKRYANRKPEVLPKIQVWTPTEDGGRGCPRLIRCIPRLQHDPKKPDDVLKVDADSGQEGDDEYDGFRYGAMAWKEIEKTIPKAYFVQEKVDEYGVGIEDINILMQIERNQASIYDRQHASGGGSFTFTRAGAPGLHRRRPN